MSAETKPATVWSFRLPDGLLPHGPDNKRIGRTWGATKLVELRRNEGGKYYIASETQILPR